MASKANVRKGQSASNDKSSYTFSDGRDIARTLESIAFEDKDTLSDVTIALRNQLSPPSTPLGSNLQIPSDDGRLLLCQTYLTSSPGAPQLFQVWDCVYSSSSSLHPPNDTLRLLVPLLSLLANLLDLLSSQYLYHQHGHAILKALLVPLYTKRLSVYISSSGKSSNELVLVSMKLWVSMAEYAGGREKQKVVETFGWDNKVIMKLLAMRRKSHSNSQSPLERPDIRTLTLAFLLSPLSPSSSVSTTMKQTYVSTSPYVDALSLIWKGLDADDALVIRYVLEHIWEGLWSDKTISRKDKIALFNERVFIELIKVYSQDQGSEGGIIPADLVHHFLLAVCTRPGVGVCFQDRGWYPRETEVGIDGVLGHRLIEEEKEVSRVDADDKNITKGKIYNKILANVLKMLKVNEDARQQELALRILSACPELVAGYWSTAGLTLQPRLSSRWITNIGFLGQVISLPVPEQTFVMPSTRDQLNATSFFYPTPPPLGNIMENIVPSALSAKTGFTKVLLGGSGIKPLVQHCASLALVKCLGKLGAVLAAWKRIEVALGEGSVDEGDLKGRVENDGQWTARRVGIIREARKRLPDFQVIQAFARQAELISASDNSGTQVRKALLAEVAQRLVWMYHTFLPDAVLETKFDVGKLLLSLEDESRSSNEAELGAPQKLAIVARLHVLRLLKDVDQFSLTSKTASSTHTNFYLLMKVYVATSVPAIRELLQSSLTHLISQTLAFQTSKESARSNLNEATLWLRCLPRSRRMELDVNGTPLVDEGESVVGFLDDCFGRCQKSVYRYIEDMHSLVDARTTSFPSPLMVTILEQLKAKVDHKFLKPSDVLAIVSFTRKLVLKLIGHLSDLVFLGAFVKQLGQIFSQELSLLPDSRVSAAINREVQTMNVYLRRVSGTEESASPNRECDMTSFLTKMEGSSKPGQHAAYEIVDFIRFSSDGLRAVDIARCFSLIDTWYPLAIGDFFEVLGPNAPVWDGLDIHLNHGKLAEHLSFDVLYVHSGLQQLRNPASQGILVELLAHESSINDYEHAMQLIAHSLSSPDRRPSALALLSTVLSKASDSSQPNLYLDLKGFLFGTLQPVKDLCTATEIHGTDLDQLISHLRGDSQHDRSVVTEITAFWIARLRAVVSGEDGYVTQALKWIRFAGEEQLLSLLDYIGEGISDTPSQSITAILRAVVTATKELLSTQSSLENELRARLPQLIALRPVLSGFYDLETLLSIALEASLPLGHDGHDVRHKYLHVTQAESLSVWAGRASNHWAYRRVPLPSELDIKNFLFQTSWAASTVSIICSLLYRHASPKQVFLKWMKTDNCAHRSTHDFALVLHAFLDTMLASGEEIPDIDGEAWIPHFTRLLKGAIDPHRPTEMRTTCAWCVSTLLRSVPTKRLQFAGILTKEVDGLRVSHFPSELIFVASRLKLDNGNSDVIVVVVTAALQWLVDVLGENRDTADVADIAGPLSLLVTPDLKPHVAEPFLTVVSKSNASTATLELSTTIVGTVALKPVVINRLLQNIVQHSQFVKLCSSPIREPMIKLLFTLFHLHPSNTCQPTHIEPLLRIYQGTLSVPDQQILSIFRLFEAQRSVSVASLLSSWSSNPDVPSANALEAVQSLEPGKVLKTSLAFPRWRRLTSDIVHVTSSLEKHLYDPVFLLLLFAQLQSESLPASTLAWVELFRSNIVGLVIRTLSGKDGRLREIAITQLTTLWSLVQNADMQEKPHVIYLLSLLKDTLDSPTDQPVRRLPSYSTLILLHALRAIFYPSNFIYPLTSSFLLQRPELDTKDVPMLYGMLYSSSDNWKKERGWIIRFLSDGMISTDDWRVFKRRHTWDLLASLFQSSEHDRALRVGILEVLANLTCNAQATTSLLLKSSLLAWIEMQISSCRDLEAIAWVKILENIMVIVDPARVEGATDGGWRDSISRCLSALLVISSKPPAPSILHIVALAMLRLSCLPGPLPSSLLPLVRLALEALERVESRSQFPRLSAVTKVELRNTLPPHSSVGLFELNNVDDVPTWGGALECLWRVSMSLQKRDGSWDELTSKLLVWRSIIGEDACDVGEWARKEVVVNLQ